MRASSEQYGIIIDVTFAAKNIFRPSLVLVSSAQGILVERYAGQMAAKGSDAL